MLARAKRDEPHIKANALVLGMVETRRCMLRKKGGCQQGVPYVLQA